MNLSVVILTKNEEENIKRCIESVSFADEILVIDDNSTDKTTLIANKNGAKVISKKLNGDFSKQRNFGLTKAKEDWVLFIDADEVVSKELSKEILSKVVQNTDIVAYRIKRIDYLFGREMEHGEVGNVFITRLAKADAGKWRRRVHETWEVNGKKEKIISPLLHYPHQGITEFISEINFYSTLHAKANKKEGKKSSVTKIVFFPIFKFLNNYFVKFGILDGAAGFVLAVLMSYHSYLAWSKLWMLRQKD